jgi:CheY-like chemotaxis protein
MAKARIMVVEDEELVALAIKTYLEGAGYDVPLVTPSGEEAVERLASAAPDLVLMDIRLRGKMNGIEAAGAIRDSSRVPVVYLTAYSDTNTLEMARATDPFGYVVKPYDERALGATIKMALHKSLSQNELVRAKEKVTTILQSMGDALVVAGCSRFSRCWTRGRGRWCPSGRRACSSTAGGSLCPTADSARGTAGA